MIVEAKETFQFDAIDDVVSDIAKGRIVIVTDDADRENEGDLVIAAEKVTPEAVNFMAKHGRGSDLRADLKRARGTTRLATNGQRKTAKCIEQTSPSRWTPRAA